jgi:IclR family transcriptional regulator, KDG regulon repressor
MSSVGLNNETGTVVRAARLLEIFTAKHPELSLSELTFRLGYNKATTYRLAQTLVSVGYLEQDETSRAYRLGLSLIRLGQVASANYDVRSRAMEQMSRLRDTFGETVYLLVARDDRSVCIERLEGTKPVRDLSASPGDAFPLFVGAGGMAMLATMSDVEQSRILDAGELAHEARGTIEGQLLDCVTRGYATAAGDVGLGAGAVAAPIFDDAGALAGALSLGGARQQIIERRDELGQAVAEAAHLASRCSAGQAGRTRQ